MDVHFVSGPQDVKGGKGDLWGAITQPPSPTSVDSIALEDALPEAVSGHDRDGIKRQREADMKATRKLRGKYADRAYQLAFGCLWYWGAMLTALGISNAFRGEQLWSDTVVIAVTTGVTVSVLAAFLGVIRGLFGHKAEHSEKEK